MKDSFFEVNPEPRPLVTLSVVGLFVGFSLLKSVVGSAFGTETVYYLFTVTSLRQVQPGWLFAPWTHANSGHLLMNSIRVLVIGYLIEPYLVRRQYISLIGSIGVLSILAHGAVITFTDPSIRVIGAGGLVWGVTAFFICQHTRTLLNTPDRPSANFATFVYLVALYHILLRFYREIGSLRDVQPESAIWIHLAGMLLGVLWWVHLRNGMKRKPTTGAVRTIDS